MGWGRGTLGLSAPLLGVTTLNQSLSLLFRITSLSNWPFEDWWLGLALTVLASVPGLPWVLGEAHTLSADCPWTRGFLPSSCVWIVFPCCLSSPWPEGQQLLLLATGCVLGSESPVVF